MPMQIGDKVLIPGNFLGLDDNGQAILSLPHLTAVVGVSQITTPVNAIIHIDPVSIQDGDASVDVNAAVWGSIV